MKPYQKERIAVIKKVLPMFGNSFVLKGGTALMLYYGLDRFSEDIDLDAFGAMDFRNRLHNPGYSAWNMRVAKDTPTVFRVMLDYGATNEYGAYPLKIEVSSRNRERLRSNYFEILEHAGVWVYSVKELIEMKVFTFGRRDRSRDLYDIGYLLRKYPNGFNETHVKSILSHMDYKGLERLSMLLADEFRQHSLGKVMADEYVLDAYMRAERVLESLFQLKERGNGQDLER